ncbi:MULTISPECIES: hypothetical protein [Filomicrobium]|uniref:Uncharacterized protein n=1 Tax=Filomicrobium insigne TaxID=418854 RepID=A0A1H0QDV7_9HYPH|nr:MULTISPECIES: hypothetical protein [Filomicrobium]MCV0369693.1 hypothetical protein [Filomicrobium sp.]SDP15517.1 hypothetical protein SAMN04488061_2341 [Filomicrobium insigne]
MQKSFIIIGTALFIATSAFSSAATAGGCGKGFGGYRGFSHHSYNQSVYAQRNRQLAKKRAIAKQRELARIKAEKRRVALAAAKARKAKLAAAAQERRAKLTKAALAQTKAEVASKNTLASTSVAALAGLERSLPTVPVTQVAEEVANTAAQITTVESSHVALGCKRYIASAGLTVNVPCEN